MEPYIYVALVWSHFLGDFMFQTDKMATRKSVSNKWLSLHVFVYTLFFVGFGLKFAIVNGLVHWCVDWVTSRITKWYWSEKDYGRFFAVIGLDQAIHYTTLFLTYQYFK